MATAKPEPGLEWLEVVSRQTLDAFALAFVPEPVLEALVALRPIIGVAGIRAFFEATRQMYRRIAFTHEVRPHERTCLEWEGEFQGGNMSGATVLAHDATGAIEHVRLHHHPFDQAASFSKELELRLAAIAAPDNDNHAR